MKKIRFIAFLVVFLLPALSSAGTIIGGETVYTVKKGDTLEMIGARFGVSWKAVASGNGLDEKKHLRPGQEVRVKTVRIIPREVSDGVVINIPDRTLYLFSDGKLLDHLPVGLGKRTWRTPTGKFRIVRKQKDPVWNVPESIQKEMEEQGKEVLVSVPPGPENPLGRYAFATSIPGILIHETIWPGSVFGLRSHGCIRVMPEHMERLFGEMSVGTEGEIIYMPVKTALDEKGRVFMEVHPDFYGKINSLKSEAESQIQKLGVSQKVDMKKVEKLLSEKTGMAEDVTL